MTKAELLDKEKAVVRDMKRIARDKPETQTPDVDFKRDWAYGNAGLENESISREQVKRTIEK